MIFAPRCIMTRLFIACDKFVLDFVFNVTRIIECFDLGSMACDLKFIYNSLAAIFTKLDIQTPVVMFYFLFKYQVSVTSFLGFMDESSIFL